ncbi:hypothetical protein PLICRDRAFT_655332 [Plicaturopsis crispa FD-325 SS-3]|nr:hypothetical protein PLICRDRAFT_655332 [Plicaturopsis crispa FD-325 SS-3]
MRMDEWHKISMNFTIPISHSDVPRVDDTRGSSKSAHTRVSWYWCTRHTSEPQHWATSPPYRTFAMSTAFYPQ